MCVLPIPHYYDYIIKLKIIYIFYTDVQLNTTYEQKEFTSNDSCYHDTIQTKLESR